MLVSETKKITLYFFKRNANIKLLCVFDQEGATERAEIIFIYCTKAIAIIFHLKAVNLILKFHLCEFSRYIH